MAGAVNGHAEGPTIPASATTLLRLQPGRKQDEPERRDARVYVLAGVSERLRAAHRAALLARGVRNPSDEELVQALAFALELARDGIDAAQFAKFSGIIERYQALTPLGEGEKPSFDRLAAEGGMAMLYRTCRASNADLDALLKQRETYYARTFATVCAVALREIVPAEDEPPITLTFDGDQVSAESLAQIPDEMQQQIGLWWLTQGTLSAAQKKTSGSALPSDTTPETIPPASADVPGPKATARSRGTKRGTPTPSTLTLAS